MSRTTTVVATALAVGALVGCGSDSDSEEDSPNGQAAKPLEAPKAKESIDEAADRMTKALESDDCDEVNELNPSSRPALANDARCAYLQRLAGLPVAGAESFDDRAGVIEFQRGEAVQAALVVADSDGRYKIAYLDPFAGEPSAKTEFSKKFDPAAQGTLRAFTEGDCALFARVAYVRFGPGRFPDEQKCEYVKNHALGKIRVTRPELIGGNDSYAYYSIGNPAVALTMIMARQTEEDVPETFPKEARKLPKGASEYAFVDAIVTDRREPPKQEGEGESKKGGGGKSENKGGG